MTSYIQASMLDLNDFVIQAEMLSYIQALLTFVYRGRNDFIYTGFNDFVYTGRNAFDIFRLE